MHEKLLKMGLLFVHTLTEKHYLIHWELLVWLMLQKYCVVTQTGNSWSSYIADLALNWLAWLQLAVQLH